MSIDRRLRPHLTAPYAAIAAARSASTDFHCGIHQLDARQQIVKTIELVEKPQLARAPPDDQEAELVHVGFDRDDVLGVENHASDWTHKFEMTVPMQDDPSRHPELPGPEPCNAEEEEHGERRRGAIWCRPGEAEIKEDDPDERDEAWSHPIQHDAPYVGIQSVLLTLVVHHQSACARCFSSCSTTLSRSG